MAVVFDHYAEPLARYLASGFSFSSDGRKLRFAGLRDRHDLHDVLAETFRCAFEQSARQAYAGLAPFEAYLYRIARNIVIDRLRSKTSQWVELDETSAGRDHQVPSPERAFIDAELAQLMRSFVRSLPSLEQQFVTLRFVEGRSQEDVAAQMNRSRRWVSKLEVKMRRRLVYSMRNTGYLGEHQVKPLQRKPGGVS